MNEYVKVDSSESPRRNLPVAEEHNEYNEPTDSLARESSSSSSQCTTESERQSSTWHTPSPADKIRAVVLFSICTILLFADQNLMSPNLSAIAQEFHFDDKQRDEKLGGDIALAFFVLGAPASYLIGCLGDTCHRTKLFAATVGLGEMGCLLTYWVQTYNQLYVCRAITGFSAGGALPLIYSILGDLFPADERHRVSAMVGIGTGVGISLGQCIAGFLGPTFGWRLPFLIVGAPAVASALAVWMLVPDPERGGMEKAVRHVHHRENTTAADEETEAGSPFVQMMSLDERVHEDKDTVEEQINNVASCDPKHYHWTRYWSTFVSIVSTPTVRLALLQGPPGCVPWGILNVFLNDFLAKNRGMTVEMATLTVLFFGLGNFVGMLVGGFGGTYLYRIDPRYPSLLAGSAAIAGCFPFWILLNWIDHSTLFLWTFAVSWLAGVASGMTGPIIKAQLQNVTLPQQRGQAFALFNTTDDFGRGLGPVFVAGLISRLGGRTKAFNVGVLGWIVCGFINLGVYFTILEDEAKLQATVVASLGLKKDESNLGEGKPPSLSLSHLEGSGLRRRSFDQERESSTHNSLD